MKRHMIIVIVTFVVCFCKWGITEAHWVPTLSGWAYHSLGCEVALKQTGHPDNAGLLRCTATVEEWEVACINPANNGIFPGAAFSQVVTVIGEGAIEEVVSGKNKGRVQGSAIVNLDALFDSKYCVNPLWVVVDVLVKRFAYIQDIYDEDGNQTASVAGDCALEQSYSVSNYPYNLPPPGHPYPCSSSVMHID